MQTDSSNLSNHDRITLAEAKRRLEHQQRTGKPHPRNGMTEARYKRMLRRGHKLKELGVIKEVKSE